MGIKAQEEKIRDWGTGIWELGSGNRELGTAIFDRVVAGLLAAGWMWERVLVP